MPKYALSIISAPSRETEFATSDLTNLCSGQDIVEPARALGPYATEVLLNFSDHKTAADFLDTTRKEHAHLSADINCLQTENRRKRLLIADMDSTMIQQECIDEIAVVAGVGDRVADITERAMQGELNFDEALKERVGLLKGLPAQELQNVFEQRIKLMPGARTLIQTMKAHGAFCALVSGGFTFFTERAAAAIGFDSNQANTLEIQDGTLTGRVVPPILGQQAKLDALHKLTKTLDISEQDALAVGDGANDLAMIKSAGLGVAYHAKPIVAAQATAQIRHNDLSALLFLQGYSHDDFSAPEPA